MNKTITSLLVVLALLLIYTLFTIDIGIISKYFVQRDFNRAFAARTAGNCDVFASFILIDVENWRRRCVLENEEGGVLYPIRHYTIVGITIHDDEALVQARIIRDFERFLTREEIEKRGLLSEGYAAFYNMKKQGNRWFINQTIAENPVRG